MIWRDANVGRVIGQWSVGRATLVQQIFINELMATSIYGGKHCNRLAQSCLQSHDEDSSLGNLLYLIYFYFIIFLAVPCSMRDLSSPTRNWNPMPSTEPPQGVLWYSFYWWRIQGGERLRIFQSHWWAKREMSGFESRPPSQSPICYISRVTNDCASVFSVDTQWTSWTPAFKTGQTSLETSTVMSGKRLMVFWEHKWCIAKSASMLEENNVDLSA